MITNQWGKMQASRKTTIEFNLFFIAFLLLGLNLANNAITRPRGSLPSDDGSMNTVLRFANNTFLWIITYVGQWLWRFLIYERYYSEPRSQRFLDLCTLVKISLFILENEPEPYHGYYLHCRSPHEFADCNMEEICGQLKREVDDMVTNQGLDDCQSFELLLTNAFRQQFKKVYLYRQPFFYLPSLEVDCLWYFLLTLFVILFDAVVFFVLVAVRITGKTYDNK